MFVDNRFALCILATRALASGATPLVTTSATSRYRAARGCHREGPLEVTSAALSKPPPKRSAEAAVSATEVDRAKGPDPFHRWDC